MLRGIQKTTIRNDNAIHSSRCSTILNKFFNLLETKRQGKLKPYLDLKWCTAILGLPKAQDSSCCRKFTRKISNAIRWRKLRTKSWAPCLCRRSFRPRWNRMHTKKRPRQSESNIEVPRFRNRGLQLVFRYTRSPLAKRPRYSKFNIEVSSLMRGPNWASLISDVLSEGTALVWSALESHPHSAYVAPTDCPRKQTLKLSYILCGFPRVLCALSFSNIHVQGIFWPLWSKMDLTLHSKAHERVVLSSFHSMSVVEFSWTSFKVKNEICS